MNALFCASLFVRETALTRATRPRLRHHNRLLVPAELPDEVTNDTLVQDLYAASKDNQAFLHARPSIGGNPLKRYKASNQSFSCNAGRSADMLAISWLSKIV